jgi:hypothetical protein
MAGFRGRGAGSSRRPAAVNQTRESAARVVAALGLTQHKAAELFDVGERTMRRWRERGPRGPAAILLRLLEDGRITIADLQDAPESAQVPMPASPPKAENQTASICNAGSTIWVRLATVHPHPRPSLARLGMLKSPNVLQSPEARDCGGNRGRPQAGWESPSINWGSVPS